MTACSYTPAANRVPKSNGSGLLASGWFTGIFVPTGPITVSGLMVSATDKVLGRQSSGGGAVEEIICTAAGRALLDDVNAAAQRSTLVLGAADTVTFGRLILGTDPTGSELLRVGGALKIGAIDAYNSYPVTSASQGDMIKWNEFGYGAYSSVQIGVPNRDVALGVDPGSIAGGNFSGDGTDVLLNRSVTFLQPNAGSTNWERADVRFGAIILGIDPGGSEELRITGAIHNTGIIKCDNTTDATSATDTSASISTAGGMAVAKKSHIGGVLFIEATTDATDKDTGSIVTEGGIASEKTQFSQTGHNVANKFRLHYDSTTGEYGPQIKLTNKTGSASVKGQIVRASTGTDMAFDIAPANSDEPIGVVYEAGVADASDAWVWGEGAVCQVLLKDATASTRGYWAQVSDTAGRADITNADPVPATHPQEIGHCLESKSSGTSVLARINLHFQ